MFLEIPQANQIAGIKGHFCKLLTNRTQLGEIWNTFIHSLEELLCIITKIVKKLEILQAYQIAATWGHFCKILTNRSQLG